MRLESLQEAYRSYLKGLGQREKTIKQCMALLVRLQAFLDARASGDLREITLSQILDLIEHLENQNLKSCTVNRYLSIIRRFLRWLYKNNLTLIPPPKKMPKLVVSTSHRAIFSAEQMETFLESIEDSIRDRCFFELLYSSGLRCFEALSLRWEDIKLTERILKVNRTKGGFQRYLPFSHHASKYLEAWGGMSTKEGWVFPGEKGKHLVYQTMRNRFRKYLEASKLRQRSLGIHSIRHSCATHLLEEGADLRYVSELLGHSSMESTVVYTHQNPLKQKRFYRMYHPRENGYYKEVDKAYKNELERLREKLKEREEFVEKYVRGRP